MPFVGALSKIPVNMAFLACRFGRLMLCRKGVKFPENYFFNPRNERHGCPFFLVSMTGTGEEFFSRHKSVEFDINPNKSIPKKKQGFTPCLKRVSSEGFEPSTN